MLTTLRNTHRMCYATLLYCAYIDWLRYALYQGCRAWVKWPCHTNLSISDALIVVWIAAGCASPSLKTLSMTESSVLVVSKPQKALQSLTTMPAPTTSLPRFTVPAWIKRKTSGLCSFSWAAGWWSWSWWHWRWWPWPWWWGWWWCLWWWWGCDDERTVLLVLWLSIMTYHERNLKQWGQLILVLDGRSRVDLSESKTPKMNYNN